MLEKLSPAGLKSRRIGLGFWGPPVEFSRGIPRSTTLFLPGMEGGVPNWKKKPGLPEILRLSVFQDKISYS
jgi:hypothetical protein